MDSELRERMDRLEGQNDAIVASVGGLAELVQVVIGQTSAITRLMAAKDEPRDGPSLEELMMQLIGLSTQQSATLLDIKAGVRALAAAQGPGPRDASEGWPA